MIKVENLSYGFPQKDLFDKISFTLEDGQHAAFIGSSGSGKSTLIDILMDPERYMYDGKLEIDYNCRMGYVSQFPQFDKSNSTTVFGYIAEVFIKLQADMATICTAMETATDIEPLLEQYQQTLDAFDALDGDHYESNITKKLNLAELGNRKDLQVSDLSGGEFKLIQVIKEMLNVPTLMIMDEPDVFLDFENLNALKNLINAHKGMMLVVTHNRYLLNHCFNKIVHLEDKDLQEFDGTYADYNFSLLQRKVELQELSVADDLEIARNEVIIDQLRSIATQNTEAARGRALEARVKIQKRLMENRIKAPFVYIKQPAIHLTAAHPMNDEVALTVKDFSIAFDEPLLEKVNFELMSTDKVALIGVNGSGKTTLLKSIFEKASEAIVLHPDASLAYLSQKNEERLDESNTLVEEFFEAGFNSLQEIKSYLKKYEFGSEIIQQKISSLSGGEKNILQLAKVSASKANFLLLDEPTSHLDTYAQLALEKAIQNYNGGILMISHDYYTIANCMDYVLMIEGRTVRKMSMRRFRKMIYASHFAQDYLLLEEKKKALETRIELALAETDFELAKTILADLEDLVLSLDEKAELS